MSELYVLTDAILTPESTVFAQVKAALGAGAKWVQWRNKPSSNLNNSNLNAPDLKLLSNLNNLCESFGAKFIVDDDAFLAREIKASGVHLGKDDMSAARAREILGAEAIIGVSCYADLGRALEAVSAGADYVAFGAMYPSATKPLAPLCPPQIVTEAKKRLKIPVCVIGGINAENIVQVSNLKPDMIAVVSAAWEGGTARENVSNLKSLIR